MHIGHSNSSAMSSENGFIMTIECGVKWRSRIEILMLKFSNWEISILTYWFTFNQHWHSNYCNVNGGKRRVPISIKATWWSKFVLTFTTLWLLCFSKDPAFHNWSACCQIKHCCVQIQTTGTTQHDWPTTKWWKASLTMSSWLKIKRNYKRSNGFLLILTLTGNIFRF